MLVGVGAPRRPHRQGMTQGCDLAARGGRATMVQGELGLTVEDGRAAMAQCVRSLGVGAGISPSPPKSRSRGEPRGGEGREGERKQRIIFFT
jgi:hypothetical protein